MAARVVCISRAIGAGAEHIAAEVARELGFRCVDEEIITRAAQRQNVNPADVADAEKRKSFFARLFDDIGAARGGEAATHAPDPGAVPPPSEDLRAMIRGAVLDTAAEGEVVIVAHAASYALGQRKDVLRAFITGSPALRAGRLVAAKAATAETAAKAIRDSDASRADYLRRFYQVERELPEHYDLVVSTDVLSAAHAAGLIVAAARDARGYYY